MMKALLLILVIAITPMAAFPTSNWLEAQRENKFTLEGFLEKLSRQQTEVNEEEENKLVQNSQPLSATSAFFKDLLTSFMQQQQRQCLQCPNPLLLQQNCHCPDNIDTCGDDDRTVINNQAAAPYRWICRIVIPDPNNPNRDIIGTGFKVKISPDLGRTVLFTAAHVLRRRTGVYHSTATIQCPGEGDVQVTDRNMWMPAVSLNVIGNWQYDYAYITYPGNSNTGFGWQGFMNDVAIRVAGTNLRSCGYPANHDTCVSQCAGLVPDPAGRTLYCDEGILDRTANNWIFANVDIDIGHSGGPLYIDTGGNYTAYGIVSLYSPGCPTGRQFNRLTAEQLYDMFSHLGVQMSYKIRAADSHSAYLHMGACTANKVGGDVYAAASNNVDDNFKIFPVQQTSSNQPNSQLFAIRAEKYSNEYLQMDGTGITAKMGKGGCTVDCHVGIDDGRNEVFHKEEDPNDGTVAFRSNTYSNVYLRLDHWEVGDPQGKETVNCQFGKYTLEKFHLEP